MKAGTRRKWGVGRIIMLFAAALLGYFVFRVYENIAVKSGWTEINAAAAHHAGERNVSVPIVVSHETGVRHTMLGVPSGDRDYPYEWIMLDATPDGLVMRNPMDGHFTLTCSYLGDLKQKVSMDPAVYKFLSARCQS